jgi:branched-chain amino acid transport system ATP-binding protein
MAAPILEVRDLHKNFGAVTAAANINVSFAPGETVGIIGANGPRVNRQAPAKPSF